MTAAPLTQNQPSPNKTDTGNGSYGICRVIDASRSPSPDPKRYAKKMDELRLPRKVTVHVLGADGEPLREADILFRIDTKARKKNPYRLGPYPTDESGTVVITRSLLDAEIDATLDSGLMDYVRIESGYPDIVIRPYSQPEIERAIDARTNAWRSLLKGEDRRWSTLDELIALYRRSQNHRFRIPETPESRACALGAWTETDAEYDYTLTLETTKA
jgi:hypothetical protein